jgi:hypothetical protein
MTSTVFRAKAANLARNRAGFGVIVVSAINAIEFSKIALGSDDIAICVPEIDRHFVITKSLKKSVKRMDIEPLLLEGPFLTRSNAHDTNDISSIAQKHNIFHEYFAFRNLGVLEEVARSLITPSTLAVHLRGTDKVGEIAPPSDEIVVKNVQAFLDHYGLDRIFLATDDLRYLKLMKESFGDKVVTGKNRKWSSNGRPLHLGYWRGQRNLELVEDVYLLSSCPYFLYSSSNVSYLSLVIGYSYFVRFQHVGIAIHQ